MTEQFRAALIAIGCDYIEVDGAYCCPAEAANAWIEDGDEEWIIPLPVEKRCRQDYEMEERFQARITVIVASDGELLVTRCERLPATDLFAA